ncbi:hypothetical protein [Pelagicoccus sp. SDUM812005]|uniref:hypothetical protein n=1 Tax=Pelagicoccus sp. SDUM812005 TaxID=3041257 RepID=UPI00280EEF72|nr:hypothetical protein [Pelagicoccus sp. SDUM812005]MDQ8182257.1 hypothetical protein [Pelagicoccus sp. SDUM812005]
MKNHHAHGNPVELYLDDSPTPIASFNTPVTFDLDTRELSDGEHTLTIRSTDSKGTKGFRVIPFVVRNGPAIDVEGIRKNESVDGIVPILINSYGKGDQTKFILSGSETPRGIPSWILALTVFVLGWGIHYLISYLYR